MTNKYLIIPIYLLITITININSAFSKPVKIKTKDFKERIYPSFVTTNKAMGERMEETTDYAFAGKIYDISYLNYTSKFAKDNGLSLDPKYINDNMSPGLQAMEFTIKNDGAAYDCTIQFLIDSKYDVDMPDQEIYIKEAGGKQRIIFPDFDYLKEKKENKQFRMNIRYGKDHPNNDQFRYHINLHLARTKKNIGKSISLREFSRRYFKDVNYFKVLTGCSTSTTDILQEKNSYILIKKKSDMNMSSLASIGKAGPDDFFYFEIPKRLVQKILPIMKDSYEHIFHINSNRSKRIINYIK